MFASILRLIIRCPRLIQRPFRFNARCYFQWMTSFLALYVIALVVLWVKFSFYLGMPFELYERKVYIREADEFIPSTLMLYNRLFELTNDTHQARMETEHALAWLRRRGNDDKYFTNSLPLGKIKLEMGDTNDSRVDVERYMMHEDSPLFRQWALHAESGCDARVWTYGGLFMYFRGLTLNRSRANAKAQGGEPAEVVINQPENNEIYHLDKGFFRITCNSTHPQLARTKVRPVLEWTAALEFEMFQNAKCPNNRDMIQMLFNGITPHENMCDDPLPVVFNNFTIVTTRYEYANVYWTILDLYDSFLVMRFFSKRPEDTTILLLDAHPQGPLDALWQKIFGHVARLSQLPLVTEMNELAWALPRGDSPLMVQAESVPLMEDFRIFLLSRLGLPLVHPFSCVFNNSRVIFIWRRDYLSHPRNPGRKISRKISNENELIMAAKKAFPSWSIRGIQLDGLPIEDQISLLSQSDILVGMHGAGLAFSTSLQPGSGMIELFPFGSAPNWHMEYLAKWSQVHYIKWTNTDIGLENREQASTHIPPRVIVDLLSKIHIKMCR